jgi:CheY-like chemotaxis protein
MSSAPTSSATPSETVLVVDDEVIARMVICEYLRDCGYKVIEAVNTDEALTVLQHSDVQVDVVLCGMSEADTAGVFMLAQWIRRHWPATDIILAGNHARAAVAAGDLCEEGPMLAKPYDPQLVSDRIKRLLAIRAATRQK